MNNFLESLKITFKNWMKIYGLISVSLLIIVISDGIVNPEDFDQLGFIIVIFWLFMLAAYAPLGFLPVLILPLLYSLCIFAARRGKHLVWLNYSPNSYVFAILLTNVWIITLYVSSVIVGGSDPLIMTPSFILLGLLVTFSCKKLIREYRMNTDRTSWSMSLIFTVLMMITCGDTPLFSVALMLIIYALTAFGENWNLIPGNYTKYLLSIDLIVYVIIVTIQTQLKEGLSIMGVLSFIGCMAIAMSLLKVQHRLLIKKQIDQGF